MLDLIQVSPVLDEVTLFYRSAPSGAWKTVHTGDSISSELKGILSPFMVLPLPSNLDGSPLYLRIFQRGIPLTIEVKTWTMPAFMAMQTLDQTIKMALLGFIGAMIFYNLFVSIIVRDLGFALNALTVISLVLFALYLSGYGVAYIWPNAPTWSNVFALIGLCGANIFGSIFIGVFIQQKDEPIFGIWPFLITPVLASLTFASALFLPEQYNQTLLMVVGAITFLIVVPILLSRSLKGNREAQILLFPMFFALIPGVIFVALDKYLGIKTIEMGNNALEMVLCGEAIFFSLALTSRIRIAEQKNRETNERLLALRSQTGAQILSAQDKERQRISKELHDGIGQNMLVILGNLKRLMSSEPNGERREEIATQTQTATQVLNDLRRISRDMHPMTLEHLGLEKSIAGLLDSIKNSGNLTTVLRSNYIEGSVPTETRLHLFRIVQECLANVMRHSEARSCSVTIQQTGMKLVLTVQDDGKGIGGKSEVSDLPKGLGFVSIDERVRAIGAKWFHENLKNGGFRIRVISHGFD